MTYPFTRATLPPHGALVETIDSVGPSPTCACAIARFIALYGESETARWQYVPEDRIDDALARRALWPSRCCTPMPRRLSP